MNYQGIITCLTEDLPKLKELGVEVLSIVQEDRMTSFRARVSKETMAKLDPLWGQVVWTLNAES